MIDSDIDIDIDSDIDIEIDIDETAVTEEFMSELPVEFFGLHWVESTGDIYYDGDELQHYDRGTEERHQLQKAALLVEEYIQQPKRQPARPRQPAPQLLTVSLHLIAAA